MKEYYRATVSFFYLKRSSKHRLRRETDDHIYIRTHLNMNINMSREIDELIWLVYLSRHVYIHIGIDIPTQRRVLQLKSTGREMKHYHRLCESINQSTEPQINHIFLHAWLKSTNRSFIRTLSTHHQETKTNKYIFVFSFFSYTRILLASRVGWETKSCRLSLSDGNFISRSLYSQTWKGNIILITAFSICIWMLNKADSS